MAALDTIRLIAPEFEGMSDADVQSFIDLATPSVAESVFKTQYSFALALYTAHLLTIFRRRDGKSGSVNSLSEGRLSIGYNAPAFNDYGALAETTYGEQFIQLRRQNIIGPRLLSDEI